MIIFVNESELASAMKKASEAHHDYELKLGKPDLDWADWYAQRMAREHQEGSGASSDWRGENV